MLKFSNTLSSTTTTHHLNHLNLHLLNHRSQQPWRQRRRPQHMTRDRTGVAPNSHHHYHNWTNHNNDNTTSTTNTTNTTLTTTTISSP